MPAPHRGRHRDRAAPGPLRVAMTKDDVEAVVEVFTPTAPTTFGDTYALADFPRWWRRRLGGLFMTARRRSSSTAKPAGASSPCFVDQTNHATRIGWYTGHLPADGPGLAPRHPVDDLPAPQRRAGLRPLPRPHPPPNASSEGERADAEALSRHYRAQSAPLPTTAVGLGDAVPLRWHEVGDHEPG